MARPSREQHRGVLAARADAVGAVHEQDLIRGASATDHAIHPAPAHAHNVTQAIAAESDPVAAGASDQHVREGLDASVRQVVVPRTAIQPARRMQLIVAQAAEEDAPSVHQDPAHEKVLASAAIDPIAVHPIPAIATVDAISVQVVNAFPL